MNKYILIITDTHGDILLINRYVKQIRQQFDINIDAALHLGDFGFWKKTDFIGIERGAFKFLVPTFVIPGNHEDPEVAFSYTREGKTLHNFRAFQDFGEVIDICGLKVLGAGSAPCVDNPKIRYPFNKESYLDIKEKWECLGKPQIDILVSHECPKGVEITGPGLGGVWLYNTGIEELMTLCQAVKPEMQINGHYHFNYEKQMLDFYHRTFDLAHRSAAILDVNVFKYIQQYKKLNPNCRESINDAIFQVALR